MLSLIPFAPFSLPIDVMVLASSPATRWVLRIGVAAGNACVAKLQREEVGALTDSSDGRALPKWHGIAFLRRLVDFRARDHEVYILGFSVKKSTYANPVKHELEHR